MSESTSILGRLSKKTSNSNLNNFFRLLVVAIAIILIAIVPKIYHDIWPTPYISTQDNFKIVFPGNPTISKLNPTSSALNGKQTGRVYSVSNQAKGTDQAVYVTSFNGLNVNGLAESDKIANLQYNVEQLAQTDNANLSNGKTSTFKGMTAVEATLTPTNSADASSYLIAFFNQDKLYMIIGSGMSQSSFNRFTNSFNLL